MATPLERIKSWGNALVLAQSKLNDAVYDAIAEMQEQPRPELWGTSTALNLTPFGHYGGNKPFINLMKHATRGWMYAGGWDEYVYTNKRDQWIYGIPAAPEHSFRNIIQVQDVGGHYDFTRLRAGTWYFVWTGPLTCTLDGAATENARLVAPNKFAIDVPATDGCYANPAFNLNVTNNTGSLQDFVATEVNGVQYPAMYHEDDEADFLAGKIFQSDWKRSLCEPKVIRFMDWAFCPQAGFNNDGTDSLETIEPANFYDDRCRVYSGSSEYDYFIPPEVMGRLCAETGADAWYSTQAKCSDASHAYIAQKFAQGARGWKGRVWSELSDESWNRAWPWYGPGQYLADKIGANIKCVDQHGNASDWIVDRIGCGTAERAFRQWEQWIKIYGRTRVVCVLAGQWSAGIDTNGMGGMLAYVDPVTGKKACDLADVYAGAPYWGLGDGSTLTTTWLIENKAWEFDPQWWIDQCKLSVDWHKNNTLGWNKDFLAKYAPKLKMACYEGGGFLACDGEMYRPDLHAYDDLKKLNDFCIAFQDGEPGREVMQYYWDNLINGNSLLYNQFNSHQYYFGKQEGLCNNQLMPESPRMALFKTLKGTATL